jgi:hypothetical protein
VKKGEVMSKYEPLRRYLEGQAADSVNADFAQLERILGFPLPPSAYRHQAWWANEAHGSHSHSRSWQDAGWETSLVNTARKTVRFQRRRRRGSPEASANPGEAPKTDLWQEAAQITGIEDREKLIEAALAALIRQETARYFAQIGGTMPDASAAPRERPFA